MDIYGREYIQSPKITLEKKTGDCDCIAVLGAYFLERQGMQPLILLLDKDGASVKHMVGLVKMDNGKEIEYGLVGENTLIEGCNSIDEAIRCYDMRLRHDPQTGKRIVYNEYLAINLNDSNLPFDWRTTEENILPYLIPAIRDGRWRRVEIAEFYIGDDTEEGDIDWLTLLGLTLMVAPVLATTSIMLCKLKKREDEV